MAFAEVTNYALIEAENYAQSCLDRERESAEVLSVECLINGYEATDRRSEAFHGYAVATQNALGKDTVVIFHDNAIPNAYKSIFILDNGITVEPWHVAGWNASQRAVYLSRFPTNVDRDGKPILRNDTLQPVDYSNWMLTPSRCYHVKVSAYVAKEND